MTRWLQADLVIINNQVQMQPCSLYKHSAAMLDAHHVIPESWWLKAGRPVASPLKELCPNCHYNTHVAIDGLIRGRDVSLLPPRCVALARDGIAGAQQNGLTPALTL
jgi:hypothetical protein